MNGHNTWFKSDPLGYVRRRLVDNMRMTSNPTPQQVRHGQLLDLLKYGYFDLSGGGMDLITRFTPLGGRSWATFFTVGDRLIIRNQKTLACFQLGENR